MYWHLVPLVALLGCATVAQPQADIAAARALFERNIGAIQKKDRDTYLSCYRPDELLVRAGPDGPKLGFAELAAGTSTVPQSWPESLEAQDLQLHWLSPGYVYGSYRYKVVFDGVASEGLSERIFALRPDGWQIVVSTAFGGPASSDPRLADLAFLSGHWGELKEGRYTEEIWSTARGGTLVGSARATLGDQTSSFEFFRIESGADGLELIAQPNGGAPTHFRLTERGNNRAVFENPAHDYPKKISYHREGNQLTAQIEGGGPTLTWRYDRQ